MATARKLVAGTGAGRPSQSDLKRAVSTAYYACFHALCRTCADMAAGMGGADKSDGAWLQAYRGVMHTRAADMLTKQVAVLRFPDAIKRFGILFKTLQDKRHAADYDPTSTFSKVDVIGLIDSAERAIDLLGRCARKHRRALAVLVLLGKPR